MSFDKLAFVKRLEGREMFSRPQAEALSEAIDQAVRDSVATKEDLLHLETSMRGDMSALDARLTGAMSALDSRLTGAMSALDSRLTGAMSALDSRLTGEMSTLRADVNRQFAELKVWVIATVASVVAGSFGIIVTLLRH